MKNSTGYVLTLSWAKVYEQKERIRQLLGHKPDKMQEMLLDAMPPSYLDDHGNIVRANGNYQVAAKRPADAGEFVARVSKIRKVRTARGKPINPQYWPEPAFGVDD